MREFSDAQSAAWSPESYNRHDDVASDDGNLGMEVMGLTSPDKIAWDGGPAAMREASEQSLQLFQKQYPSFTMDFSSSLKLPTFTQDPAVSFHFLGQFIKDVGLVRSFESDAVLETLRKATLNRLKERLFITDTATSPSEPSRTSEGMPWTPILHPEAITLVDESLNHNSVDDPDESLVDEQDIQMADPRHSVSDLEHLTSQSDIELAIKSSELVDCLRKRIIVKSFHLQKAQTSWSPKMEAMCIEFFSPPKIRIFLEAYWSIWSPNCPIIHRPTFDPLATPVTLLSALILMGASHSPSAVDREDAHFWYDHVEEMVFENPYFLLAISTPGTRQMSGISRRRTVQAIQAAYTMCICQNWDGSLSTRLRIRRRRFGDVITVESPCTSFFCRCATLTFKRQPDLWDFRHLDIPILYP